MLPEIPVDSTPLLVYDFLHVNGFVYRCNRVSGEMWRLEPSAADKKIQVWTPIADVTAATH